MPEQTRHARGSYASLICTNCSARKTKCRLPSDINIQPSDRPQAGVSACQRCRDLGLDCIVRATLLGRSRRTREHAARLKSSLPLDDLTTTRGSSEENITHDNNVRDFLLLTIPDDPPSPQASQSGPGFNMEMFEALLSPQHLMAAILSHDHTFGAAIPNAAPYNHKALPALISNGMATLLDEHLIWHRFYVPSTPTLVSLRETLLAESVTFPLATATLFVLLALLALEAPSNLLREDPSLRAQLRSALRHYGDELVLTSPAHRYTLSVFLLLYHYKINALANSQRTARVAIKSTLYITLARSVAQRLGLEDAVHRLEDMLEDDEQPPALIDAPTHVEACALDVMQWSTIIVLEGRGADAQFNTILPALTHSVGQIESAVGVLSAVMQQYKFPPRVVYHFASLKSQMCLMQYVVAAHRCWEDLTNLGRLIRSHEQCSRELNTDILSMLHQTKSSSKGSTDEVVYAEVLVAMQLEQHQAVVSGLAILFALMASFRHRHRQEQEQSKHTDDSPDVNPRQAVQIASDLIHHFKLQQSGPILDLTRFLSEFGDEREARIMRILSGFANAFTQEPSSSADSASWIPPPRRAALDCLFYCKLFVENSAARMQGWGALHPMVDEHLKIFLACADRLESLATGGSRTRSLGDAFADGCLFAASAKLIRSLHKIVAGWRARLAAAVENQQRSEADIVAGYPPAVVDAAAILPDVADFDELFTQWSDWPQIDLMDFARHMPDDATF